jgi:hypothetical protein
VLATFRVREILIVRAGAGPLRWYCRWPGCDGTRGGLCWERRIESGLRRPLLFQSCNLLFQSCDLLEHTIEQSGVPMLVVPILILKTELVHTAHDAGIRSLVNAGRVWRVQRRIRDAAMLEMQG